MADLDMESNLSLSELAQAPLDIMSMLFQYMRLKDRFTSRLSVRPGQRQQQQQHTAFMQLQDLN